MENPIKTVLSVLKQFLLYEASVKWFIKLDITEENKDAVIEWLNDRSQFHIWLTSIITGSIIFFAATQEPATLQTTDINTTLKLISFMLMFFSIIANIVCIWSIPTWKYRIKTGQVTQGAIMRFELGTSAWLSVLSFLLGIMGATVSVIIPG